MLQTSLRGTVGGFHCRFAAFTVRRCRFLSTDSRPVCEQNEENRWRPNQTKIVSTIGPKSEHLPVLNKLIRNGVRVMRINLSHATNEEIDLRYNNLISCEGRRESHGYNELLRGVMFDTKGPEIRTGILVDDDEKNGAIYLNRQNSITLETSEEWKTASTKDNLYISYKSLGSVVQRNSKVLLDDGAISLTVDRIASDGKSVMCTIDNNGWLKSRRGVNLPDTVLLDLPALTDYDKEKLIYGLNKGMIDFVAASFIRKASDVRDVKEFIAHNLPEGVTTTPMVVAKIETQEAVDNFDEILRESDAIMVARGDLGVEVPINEVTNIQKDLITKCNVVGKPVVVATQMLESMTQNPRPTRAEVSDVANAVFDGSDCVMLSGETAAGDFPIETVVTMQKIIESSEAFKQPQLLRKIRVDAGRGTGRDAIAAAAKTAAEAIGAAAIIVLTKGGGTARMISKHRPGVPIICFCEDCAVGRQLQLSRGCHPIGSLYNVPKLEMPEVAVGKAKAIGLLQPGDTYILVRGHQERALKTSLLLIGVV